MSFDVGTMGKVRNAYTVSIPLEQGSVFRRKLIVTGGWLYMVSIPLEQGSVFRQKTHYRSECGS